MTTLLPLLAIWAAGLTSGSGAPAALPSTSRPTASRAIILEIRVYTLKPGARDRFHETVVRDALPMLRRAHIDVVGYGPSPHDDVSYYLLRAFGDLGNRTQAEDAFYGSAEWINGPREGIIAAIEHYSTAVVELDEGTVAALRSGLALRAQASAPDTRPQNSDPAIDRAADIALLLKLNEDYVRSVQHSDAERFKAIMAPDFLGTMSDGSLVDHDAFLRLVAEPAGISNLQAHDVNIRLLGDVAIVHARTTYTTADGRSGASRYTDVWARRQGRWVAVAAQVTRIPARSPGPVQ